MKTTFYLFCTVVLLTVSCTKKNSETPTSVNITILDDITDSRLVHPNAQTIYTLLGLEKDKKKEVHIKVRPITDMLLNNTKELHLPNSTVTEKDNRFDDAYHREKCIKNFYHTIDTTIKEYKKSISDTSLAYTECYKSIVEEVKQIQKRNCTENYLVIYSDLIEHSTILKSYENGGLKYLDTGVIHKAFEYGKDIPKNLQNLTVIFIFQPRGRAEDKAFQLFFSVYKSYFESRGAKVILKSNNLQTNIL